MSENHSHLVDQTNNDLTQIQNQLKMLIGDCVLQSQKFENLMKKKLDFNQSIVMDNKGNIVTSNRLDLTNKSLGCLIEQFFKSIIPVENFIEDNDSIGVKEVENWNQKNFFYAKRNSFMPQAELDKLKSEWKELLDSRNRLVHHFYEDNTISTIEGCLIAKDRLTKLAKQMDANLIQMQHYLNKDKISSEMLSSDFIVEIIDSLINTDEEVEPR